MDPVMKSHSQSLSYLHPVIFGDSLAEGMLYQELRPKLTEYDIQSTKVNYYVGKPFSTVVSHIKEAYASGQIQKGGTLVVFAGMNDLTALTSPVWDTLNSAAARVARMDKAVAALEGSVESFLRWARDNGLKVVLSTLPPCKEHKSLRHLKKEYSADSMAEIPKFNSFMLGKRSADVHVMDLSPLARRNPDGTPSDAMERRLTADGLHPNPEGYKIVADLLIQSIKDFQH